ncbi:hypothetical protein C8R48DRAFT_672092 [Suillus tomentosus]|nr:hypothetical protein C8R48DRAFT_672092 [Suillus tomentosus]
MRVEKLLNLRNLQPSLQKKAKYFKASRRLKSDNWEEISKYAYKELLNWCAVEQVKLPITDIFVAYEYEGADEKYVAPMGSVISANEMAAYVLGIAPQPKSICAPSAATPAVMTGETSSSAHHKPVHVAKDSLPVIMSTESSSDSPPVATSNAEPSSLENIKPQGPLTATASIPMNVSFEKQDQSQCPVTMCAGTLKLLEVKMPEIIRHIKGNWTTLDTTVMMHPHSTDRDRPVHKDFHVLLKENEHHDDRHFNNSDDYRCGNHDGTYPHSYATSLSLSLCLTLPHHQECLAFLNGHSSSSRKRMILSVSLPSRAEANKRLRMAAPPMFSRLTLMNRLHDIDTFPAASPPMLMERIHNVTTFPVVSPPAPEPSPSQQLQPTQVQTLPVTAEVGLPLIEFKP